MKRNQMCMCKYFHVCCLQCLRRSVLRHPSNHRGDCYLSATQSLSMMMKKKMILWWRAHGGRATQSPHPRLRSKICCVIKLRVQRQGCPLPFLFLDKRRHRWPLPNTPFQRLWPWMTRPALRKSLHPYWKDWKRKTSSPVPHFFHRTHWVTVFFGFLHSNYFCSDFPLCSSCFVVFTSEGSKDPPVSGKGFKKPASRSLGEPPVNMQTPDKPTILKPTVSQTEPRHYPLSRYF